MPPARSHHNQPVTDRSFINRRCGFCLKILPSTTGVKRHIQQVLPCRRAWEAWIEAKQARRRARSEGVASGNGPSADSEVHNSDDSDIASEAFNNELQDENQFSDFSIPMQDEDTTHSHRATVNNVPDEDEIFHWVEKYPGRAGEIIASGGDFETTFQRWRREDQEAGRSRWYPFESREEWELGCWLARNAGQNQIEQFLHLTLVRAAELSLKAAAKLHIRYNASGYQQRVITGS